MSSQRRTRKHRRAALGLLRREFRPHGYVFTADGWRVAQGVRDA